MVCDYGLTVSCFAVSWDTCLLSNWTTNILSKLEFQLTAKQQTVKP